MLLFQIFINILFFILLPYWLIGMIHKSRRGQQHKMLKGIIHTVNHQLRANRDLYNEEQIERFQYILARCKSLLKSKDYSERKNFIKGVEPELDKVVIVPSNRMAHEILDTIVVVIGVVFGIRALFLQPFKIPTGSMQPTLYGIHMEDNDKEGSLPGFLGDYYDYWNYGRRHVNATLENDSEVIAVPAQLNKQWMMCDSKLMNAIEGTERLTEAEFRSRVITDSSNIPKERSFFRVKAAPLFPWLDYPVAIKKADGSEVIQTFRVPGDLMGCLPVYQKYFQSVLTGEAKNSYKAGERLVDADIVEGDHLFVDRFTYNFREPQRGDVTVFTTDDFPPDTMAGRFYIKRLVGMPGDELKIGPNNQMMVKEKGSDKFVPLDGKFGEAFARINSWKGGYKGHAPVGCFDPRYEEYRFDNNGGVHETYKQYNFKSKNGVFKVPDGYYFMLGDNTYNSRDSRYFGPVPRRNIAGRALMCWWPLSRRWGIVDSVEPEPFNSER